jgi:hypothetical protein
VQRNGLFKAPDKLAEVASGAACLNAPPAHCCNA